MTQDGKKPRGMNRFTLIWIGQVISLLGSGLTSFALGVWVLERTDSVTQFTLIIVIAGLPGVVLSPLAGALVDRWDRRTVMILSDVGAALSTLLVVVLLLTDQLTIGWIYLAVALGALSNTFQWPAFMASITLLVPRRQLARANGMIEFGHAGSTITAPVLAGVLIGFIGIEGVILVDFATFFFAITALLLVRIPNPEKSAEARQAEGSLFREAARGWTYIQERPGLFHLLMLFAGVNFVNSMCTVAIMPMVIRFASKAELGMVMSFGGVGMLLGSLAMAATGGPKRRIHGVLLGGFVSGFFIILAGWRPSVLLVAAGMLLWHAMGPVINASSQAIWQAKVEPDLQGRVFAIRRMLAQFTVPLGDFSAGPLSDYIFEPLMAEGGALAGTLGPILGTGPGRGIGLLLIVAAVVPFLFSIVGYLNPRVRNVETELPDVVPEEVGEVAGEVDDEAASAAAEPRPAEGG